MSRSMAMAWVVRQLECREDEIWQPDFAELRRCMMIHPR